MSKPRVAVVGYGVIGRWHATILQKRGTLCAICDTDPAALDAARTDAPSATLCGDYLALLETVKPDAVHICTPHVLHAEMVAEALRRDIHVLCEKPLCIREEEIDEILAAERSSRAMLGVCLQNRYNEANRYVKDYLQNAVQVSGMGQVAWRRTADYYASGAWRGRWATEGGGVLINQALHTLDLMQWFLGMPDEVVATTETLTLGDAIEVEDTAALVCRGKHDFTFFATNTAPTDFPVLIQLMADGKRVTVLTDRVLIDGEAVQLDTGAQAASPKTCYGNGHERLIADFYAHIESGRHFEIDGAEGARVVRLILAAYRSHGRPTRPTEQQAPKGEETADETVFG